MFRSQAIPIEKFLGVNRRDGADLVGKNEFYTLQNVYPKTKGMFYKREGSIADIAAADIPHCGGIAGIHRYADPSGVRSTLYYCRKGSTTIPNPDPADFSIAELGAGTGLLRDATQQVYVTYVGRGTESAPVSLGTINMTDGTRAIRVTSLAAFPDGVQSVNVFVRPTDGTFPETNFGFGGYITASLGTVDILSDWWGFPAEDDDLARPTWCTFPSTGTPYQVVDGGGTLQPGVYYLSSCWNAAAYKNVGWLSVADPSDSIDEYLVVRVERPNSAIRVCLKSATGNYPSGTGPKYNHIFMGFRKPSEGPLQWVGQRRVRTTDIVTGFEDEILEITGLANGVNAQSSPTYEGQLQVAAVPTTYNAAFFDPRLKFPYALGVQQPCDFIVKKDENNVVTEIMFSGSHSVNLFYDPFRRTFSSAIFNTSLQAHLAELGTPGIRPISFESFVGFCFMANATNVLLQTDGYNLYELVTAPGTAQPGYPQDVKVLKNQLVGIFKTTREATGFIPRALNQLFGSNALDPYNWADGGTGLDVRFATIGDGFADGLTAIGLFSFNSAVDGPNTSVACFKKTSTWLLSGIPDATAGVPASANAISGETGCISPDTAIPTAIGLVFLGSDGDVYWIASSGGEPRRIGGRVRPLLEHLTQNEALMRRATACYHEGFYKLSYPSSLTSTTNDAELWADLRVEQGAPITWAGPHIGINVGPQITFKIDGDIFQRLCVVDSPTSSTAYLNEPSTFQDLGSPIVSAIEWKTSRMGSMLNIKRYFGMLLDMYYSTQYAHAVMLEGFADAEYSQQNRTLSTGTGVWDSSSFDQSNWGDAMFFPVTMFFAPSNLIGRTFRWKLTHSNNAQFILAGASILQQPERRLITQ